MAILIIITQFLFASSTIILAIDAGTNEIENNPTDIKLIPTLSQNIVLLNDTATVSYV